MNKIYKEKFPKWINDNNVYDICLTDDIDSLFSCILLEKIKGYKVTHFYQFDKIYQSNTYVQGQYKIVGIDLDLGKGKCWGNHATRLNNLDSANLNSNIDYKNYYKKYAGSTLLEIISFYDYDISNLSEEAKMVLLSIDSTYMMYTFNKSNCKKWLVDVLELPELYELCEKHNDEEFDELKKKYKLKEKIFIKDGKLKTDIDLKSLSQLFNLSFILPENSFKLVQEYTDIGVDIRDYTYFISKLKRDKHKIVTQAMVKRDFFKVSYY